ncbi:MAG TPA: protein kinase [Nocardioides sp.]|nr:protein kinase [Nocardioides sp.]
MDRTPVGPGTLLAGRFVLEDLLDETEGARFWRATDKILARSVAVHVIAADDPRSAALLNAARTSATVSDGHLLRVLDAASEDGVTYVVNEWGNGVSLDRLIAEGPLSARRAAWVAKEVAEAISTAHRHGIAHGRLLPENVLITEAGSVKLIGFVVDAVLRGREQARSATGRRLGEHEADVVNLAALLYAGLTARWPGMVGSSLPDAPRDGGRPLRPRQVRAGVPRPLDTICERVLAGEEPGDGAGLATAHEIYAALCDFIGDPSGGAPVEFEPTAFFDEAELAQIRDEGRSGDEQAADGPSSDEGPATVAHAAPLRDADPEATVAGHPWAAGADPEATQAAPLASPDRADGTSRHRDAPAPPPPFPPEEPRPLFASDQPRAVPPAAPVRSTGPGSGRIPPVWGPDPVEEPSDDWETGATGWTDDPPGRSWFRLAVVVAAVVLVVVAVVVAFNLGRGSGVLEEEPEASPSGTSSAPAEPVRIASASDFDPAGDGSENPDSAPLAVDGDPSTAWPTVTYYDPLELQKPGVGLLLDLGEATEVSEVDVSFLTTPTDVEILAGGEGAAPTSADGLQRVARATGSGDRATLTLDEPVTTRYLVVWLTKLPAADGGFRGQVAEIVVR